MLPKLTHPTTATLLPSTQKTVRFRPMQAREEKLLLHAKESEDRDEIMTVVSQVVQNCVQDETFNAQNATIFDIEWLFLRIRMQSVSPVADVSYVDRSDKKQYDFQIDLDKVELVREPVDTSLKLSEEIAVELRWPTVADYIRAATVHGSNEAKMVDELECAAIGKVFNGDEVIDAQKQSREELLEFVNSFDLENHRKLEKFIDGTPHLRYVIEYKNSKGEDRKIVLSKLTDFFAFR